jgi:hypothetical protein
VPSLNHIHTYGAYKGRPKCMRCYDPSCTHFIDREVALGKWTRCHSCGAEFVLSREDMRRVKPKCVKCSDTAHGKRARAADSLIDSLDVFNKKDGREEEPPELEDIIL